MRFNELKDYRKEHGNCNVPANYPPNEKLGRWVKTQRAQHRKLNKEGNRSWITKERVAKLDSINFVWNLGWDGSGLITDDLWETRFNELKDYRKEHGNCNVPQTYEPNRKLGHWVLTQRAHYRKFHNGGGSLLTKEKISKLNSIDFVWDPRKRKKLGRSEASHQVNDTGGIADNNVEKGKKRKRDVADVEDDKELPFNSSERARIYFRDECLAIALKVADRKVWQIRN